MKKVAIIYNYILHYRVPFFNELAKYYDVTVVHSGNSIFDSNNSYKEKILPCKKIGPFFIQKNLRKTIYDGDYDIVITLFDLRWIMSLLYFLETKFFKKNQTNLLWGAWLTKSKIANYIRFYFMRVNSYNVFYTQKAKSDFVRMGLKEKTCFVGNNTFHIPNEIRTDCSSSYDKEYILTVGSLNYRKDIQSLITAFNNTISLIPNNIKLVIVGKGEEENNLKKYVDSLGITDRVLFLGEINSPHELLQIYKKTIFCASYAQAGLFVLQSMGYGVPFVTKKTAISGGEKYNIQNNINGFLVGEDLKELESSIVELSNDLDKAKTMGHFAFNYYSQYCTIENMVEGFLDSINNKNNASVDIRQNNYDF